MLWRGSRRWSTYQPHQAIHRFLVSDPLNPRVCLLQSFWSARRSSSSASAEAFLRRDASVSAQRRPRQGHKDEQKLSELNQKHKERRTSEQEDGLGLSVETLPMPTDFLVWLDKHFASEPSRKHVCQYINQNQDRMQFLNDTESVCHSAEKLAQTSLPHRALYVLQAAHSIGLVFKQNFYERIVFRLAKAGEWNLVLSVVAAGLGATGKSTARLLNWRGRALVEVQDFAKLDGLLGEFAMHGQKPQRRTFLIILQGHLLNHDLARAKSTIQDMESAGFRVTAGTYMVIIPAYRGFGLDSFVQDRGHDVLNSHTARGKEKILNGLLRLHLDKHDLEGALQLLETFGSHEKAPESVDTSIVTDGGDHTTGAANPPHRRATLADRATYTLLINYLSMHGDRTKSLNGILKRMRTGGSPPDIKVGACLVRMYYVRGAEHKALSILCDCCKHLKLQVTVLKSLGYDPRYPEPSVFAPFIGQPTTELFNRVLQGAIQIRGLGATIAVLRLMKRAQVKPDAQTLEVFLWHLTKERLILTKDLVDIMKSLLSFRIQPTLKALNIIFESIVRSAKLAVNKPGWNALATFAQQAIESLEASGARPSSARRSKRTGISFDPDLCMTDLQSTVFSDVLQPIIRSLRRRQILADRVTFSLRMRYDSFTLPPVNAAESVARNLQIMRDRGLHPNAYHYAALMEAHCAAGNVPAARDVLQDTIARGLIPQQKSHVVMYTILISANARVGRPDLALSIFKDMLNANIAPDAASIDSLVGAFFAVKAFRLARRVLLDLWPMITPFPKELRDASLGVLMARLRSIRAQAESPRPEVKKSFALNRDELIARINEIIAEWNKVVQAGDEDEPCDDSDEEEVSVHSDVGREVESRQVDTLWSNNEDKY